MNPWLIIAAIAAMLGCFVTGLHEGVQHERTAWVAKTEKQRADSNASALAQTTMWQGVVNGTVKNYEAKVNRINGDLAAALDQLQHRPQRASGAGQAPRAGCEGGTGAELSREDARFLTREAARADDIRAGLVACYEVLDGVK